MKRVLHISSALYGGGAAAVFRETTLCDYDKIYKDFKKKRESIVELKIKNSYIQTIEKFY